MTKNSKQKLIEKFVGKLYDSINIPNWDNISIIDCSRIRFCDDFICVFRKDGVEKYELTKNESCEIKNRITDIKETERYKQNVANYEAFEIRRKQLGVTDRIIEKLYIGGYELHFTNTKTKEETCIGNGGSNYYIAKLLVKAIDDGELNIKEIRFSISTDMMNLLN